MKIKRIFVIVLMFFLLNIMVVSDVIATNENIDEVVNDTTSEEIVSNEEIEKQEEIISEVISASVTEEDYDALIENNKDENEVIFATAKIIEAGEVYERDTMGYKLKTQDVTIQVLDGKYKGQILKSTYSVSYDIDGKIEGYPLDKGNKVDVQISASGGEITSVEVQDLIRQNYILLMLFVFFALIVIVGRKQGIKAIAAFIITIVAIFLVMLPLIMKGFSPILIAIGISAIIIVLSFIVIAGFNRKSFTAMLGTVGGVVFAGIMAAIFGIIAKLSGGQEEALYLSMNTQNIVFNYRELLFAGIIVAALGACMDVGMSIASALDELKQKNPNLTPKELFKSGMNIGGDVIGTMTNTLILAYVGGAISLVLLFMVNDMTLANIFNTERIATDTISAIAASMGVIFTVPLTSLSYAVLHVNTKYRQKEVSKDRSLKI